MYRFSERVIYATTPLKTMLKKIRNPQELAKKAILGKLTNDEIAYVVQRIKDSKSIDDSDLPLLIEILGICGAVQYRELVEKFLYYPSNEWVCVRSLRTLCRYWGFTSNYLDEIKMFIKGAKWDQTDEVRIVAISIAGEFLRETYDRELLQLLLEVFENLGKSDTIHEISDYARELIQSCAYDALSRALGKNHDEIPDVGEIEEAIRNRQLNNLDLTIIQKAHQMLQEKS